MVRVSVMDRIRDRVRDRVSVRILIQTTGIMDPWFLESWILRIRMQEHLKNP